MPTRTVRRQIAVISVPFDFGSGLSLPKEAHLQTTRDAEGAEQPINIFWRQKFRERRRGARLGPTAVIDSGLFDKLEDLHCNPEMFSEVELPESRNIESTTSPYFEDLQTGSLRYLDEVVVLNNKLAREVAQAVSKKSFPLVLGGDHSLAIGTIGGLLEHYDNMGVIWCDAHADLNTHETTPSGNIHGMPLRVVLGEGDKKLLSIGRAKNGRARRRVDPRNVVLLATRQLDPGEREFLREHKLRTYTMSYIDEFGMAAAVKDAIAYLRRRKVDGVHLSFDIDSLDPSEAPGTGTPVRGGLTYREAHTAMELLGDSGLITSAEFVEVNPMLDEDNRTAQLCVELIGSLFGERIL